MYAIGSQIQIESTGSWSQDRSPEEQDRLRALVGEIRTVIDFDRYGFVWLSLSPEGKSRDFCLKESEVSMIAPPPAKTEEEVEFRQDTPWRRLRKTNARLEASTAIVLCALGGCVFAAAVAWFPVLGFPRELTALVMAFPIVGLVAGGMFAAVYWYRQRRWQFVIELVLCAALCLVFVIARR